jgi:arginase
MRRFNSNLVTIFGSCMRHGQPFKGVEKAPLFLSKHGIAGKLVEKGNKVKHFGFKYPKIRDTKERTIGLFSAQLAQNVYRERRRCNRRILNIGGDHSVAIGSINGILENDPDALIIWVDAHADLNDKQTSETGNIHGMPLAYLTGCENPNVPGFSMSKYVRPKLDKDSVVYIGLRDVDFHEKEKIAQNNMTHYTSEEVASFGATEIINDALALKDPMGTRPIYLSFDIDSIDPRWTPSTGTPVSDGMSIYNAMDLCRTLNMTKRVIGMDLVEFNPDLQKNITDVAKTMKSSMILPQLVFNNRI